MEVTPGTWCHSRVGLLGRASIQQVRQLEQVWSFKVLFYGDFEQYSTRFCVVCLQHSIPSFDQFVAFKYQNKKLLLLSKFDERSNKVQNLMFRKKSLTIFNSNINIRFERYICILKTFFKNFSIKYEFMRS